MTDETHPGEDVVVVAGRFPTTRGLSPRRRSRPGRPCPDRGRFADTETAMAIYDVLIEAEISGDLDIDGVLVAKADEGGRITSRR